MPTLIERRVALSIGDLKVHPGHHITFKAKKNYKPSANNFCEVKIDNLSPEQRTAITKSKTPLVRLAAGYGDDDSGLTQLFFGNSIFHKHEINGDTADVTTTLSTTDGGTEKQTARINVSFGKGTSTGQVIKRIVQALGLNAGNSDKIAREIDASLKANIFIEGAMISGAAADELTHVCRSCGYDWSVQDRTVQIRKFGDSADKFAIELSPDTGLIGSPSMSGKGVVSGRCLIFKAGAGLDLTPGRLLRIDSAYVKGQYILASAEFDADNYVQNWYCDFEAVATKAELAKIK